MFGSTTTPSKRAHCRDLSSNGEAPLRLVQAGSPCLEDFGRAWWPTCVPLPVLWRVSPDKIGREGRMSILDEAASITQGERLADYGHPRENHLRTAALWNAYFAAQRIGHPPSDWPL